MTSALMLPSESELRRVSWTLSELEQLWATVDKLADNSQFRKDFRINRKREYKILREELYPLLWFTRNAVVKDDVTIRLTSHGDVWDASLEGPDYPKSMLQITLAYRSGSGHTPGYENALRMELLNDSGHAPAFGHVYRDDLTKQVKAEPCAVENGTLIAAYAGGIKDALNRKANYRTGEGDLIVFIDDWMIGLGMEGFVSVMDHVKVNLIDADYRRLYVVAGMYGAFQGFAYDRQFSRLPPSA